MSKIIALHMKKYLQCEKVPNIFKDEYKCIDGC